MCSHLGESKRSPVCSVVHQELLRGGVKHNGRRHFGLCLRDASVLDVIDFVRGRFSHRSKDPGWNTLFILYRGQENNLGVEFLK